jgi:hypothetical protein
VTANLSKPYGTGCTSPTTATSVTDNSPTRLPGRLPHPGRELHCRVQTPISLVKPSNSFVTPASRSPTTSSAISAPTTTELLNVHGRYHIDLD